MAKRPNTLMRMSVSDLRRELARRQRRIGTLVRRHQRLVAKASKLAEEIRELGGSVTGSVGLGRTRPKNEMNLVDSLVKVLKGKTMSVTDVADAVQKAGYQTTAANFRTIVNQALINSGKFKRVERGRYTAK
jgi:hypothetical protein